MKWLLERTIPCAKIFEIATDFDHFEKWLKKEHNKSIDKRIFLGYKYFLECTFSSIFDSIANDSALDIESDFLFNRAIGEVFYIEKLPNTCEKTILLKNIYSFYKPIEKSKSYQEIKQSLPLFHKEVLSVISSVYDDCFSLNKSFKISKELATELSIIEALYLLFNQIKNNGPVAYEGQLLKEWWPTKEKLDTYLYGYAFTVQFIWYKVLGVKRFRKSHIKNIHEADSWRNYKYIEKSPSNTEDEISYLLYKTYNLEEQTCFDSYFDWLRKEIIQPLESKYDFFLKHSDSLFNAKKPDKVREKFINLLSENSIQQIKVSLEEELDMLLYWYPVEIANFDTNSMHSGIPALITLMSGTAFLLEKQGEFDNVYICRFIHPRNKENGNDYSYCILIDAKASAGHYSSGWMLYYDCCGDYSGFSGSEHKKIEETINNFQKKKIIRLASKIISKKDFKNYIGRYLPEKERVHNYKEEVNLIKPLDTITLKKELNDFISNSKALVLELVSYYVTTKYKGYKDIFLLKDWSVNSENGEIDVLLENESDALLIECKTNINNGCLQDYIDKAKSKLQDKCAGKKHRVEFWCWYDPSKKNGIKINEEGCDYLLLKSDQKLKFRNLLRTSRISQILDFDKTNEEYFEIRKTGALNCNE